MITLNINIGGDGKSLSTSSSAKTHVQDWVPGPEDAQSKADSGIPSPRNIGVDIDSAESSAVPHPEHFETAESIKIDHAPVPFVGIDSVQGFKDVAPNPMDMEKQGSASTSTKPKPTTTKRKPKAK